MTSPFATANSPRYAETYTDIRNSPTKVRTANIVAEQLESYGIEVHQGLGKTGVVGTLRNGGGNRAIALRADMDALGDGRTQYLRP